MKSTYIVTINTDTDDPDSVMRDTVDLDGRVHGRHRRHRHADPEGKRIASIRALFDPDNGIVRTRS